jgi:hypothetical protein
MSISLQKTQSRGSHESKPIKLSSVVLALSWPTDEHDFRTTQMNPISRTPIDTSRESLQPQLSSLSPLSPHSTLSRTSPTSTVSTRRVSWHVRCVLCGGLRSPRGGVHRAIMLRMEDGVVSDRFVSAFSPHAQQDGMFTFRYIPPIP